MRSISKKIQHQDPDALAAGYTSKIRYLDVGSIVTYFGLIVIIAWRFVPVARSTPWLFLSAGLSGYLAADFVSGFVHWLGDTWGSRNTPVLGEAMVRPFREHHVDQKAITRHDFIETNGNNCLISIPVGAMCCLIPLGPGGWQDLRVFVTVTMASMIFWVMATNQFHKWAHADDDERPALASWLQRMHLILPPAHHAIHHAAPYAKYYCITVGWLNWPLHKIGFFRIAEQFTTAWFGWIPRQDDIGTAAAIEAAPAAEPTRPARSLEPASGQ